MIKKVSERGVLGFFVSALIQVAFAMVLMVVSGPNSDPLFLIRVLYLCLAFAGLVFMIYGKVGDWIEDRKNYVYVTLGLLIPVIGLVYFLWFVARFSLFFLSFRWLVSFIRFLGSRE